VLAEGDVFVQEEGHQGGDDDGQGLGNQWVPVSQINAEIQYQGVEQQADDLYQIKKAKTQDGLVFLFEVDLPVQDETAYDAAVEGDGIGPKIRHDPVQYREYAELQRGADHAEQRIENKVPMTPINTA
jgi:hypothetical protein